MTYLVLTEWLCVQTTNQCVLVSAEAVKDKKRLDITRGQNTEVEYINMHLLTNNSYPQLVHIYY